MMNKLGDMDLFVRVIRNGSLAAAGREVGLSPARMTARINGLEKHYGVRLLLRTTRQISLTEEGREFLAACERILAEVAQTESKLQSGITQISGPLKITATFDLGRQHVASVLSRFTRLHPDVSPQLVLDDGILNITDGGFDLGIRYGMLPDSTLIARRLAPSHRVLCASPDYLARNGTPGNPRELLNHDCLMITGREQVQSTWHFKSANDSCSIVVPHSRSSNDGSLIREWAVEGAGIALKSILDITPDIKAGRLVTILSDYTHDFAQKGTAGGADLHVVYPSRQFLPERTRGFVEALGDYFSAL